MGREQTETRGQHERLQCSAHTHDHLFMMLLWLKRREISALLARR
jgi:hypothetical protein